MDRWGRFDLQDGMQVYGALRGIQNDQRQNELYQKRLAEEQQYKTELGNLQKDPEYKPDMAAPGYNPEAYNKAVLQNLSTSMAAEDFQIKKSENAQKRVELQRNNIARGASDAMAIYQTDPQAGTMAMVKVYDSLHDGIELVKDENGNPLIDEQGQITLKGLNGKTVKAPIPPMGEMVKMAQMYTDPKNIQKVDAMSSDAYRAANASAIAKAKHYQNDQGQVVAVVDQLYDPIDRSKTQTVVLDLRTGQPIDPAEFAQGGFREISHESTEKFEQQKALKGIEYSNEVALAGYKSGLKMREDTVEASRKGGVGSAEANRQLELVLMPFAPGKQRSSLEDMLVAMSGGDDKSKKKAEASKSKDEPLTTEGGSLTEEGLTAIRNAERVYDKYTAKAPGTPAEQRAFDQAQRALQVYSTMHEQVVDRWTGQPAQVPTQAAPSPASGGGRIPGHNPVSALGGPSSQQQGGGLDLARFKAEFQALARQVGRDEAKRRVRLKYPGLAGR